MQHCLFSFFINAYLGSLRQINLNTNRLSKNRRVLLDSKFSSISFRIILVELKVDTTIFSPEILGKKCDYNNWQKQPTDDNKQNLYVGKYSVSCFILWLWALTQMKKYYIFIKFSIFYSIFNFSSNLSLFLAADVISKPNLQCAKAFKPSPVDFIKTQIMDIHRFFLP